MNAHDDERIDEALEALARPEPSADHVARVLARTSGRAGSPLRLRSGHASRPLPWWAMATAAAVVVALGVTWQVGRMSVAMPEVQTAWGAPQEVDRPVLPPQAYWGMDAFEEWDSLRSGTGIRGAGTGGASSQGGRGVPARSNPAASPGSSGAGAAPQWAWVPVPSGLPPIELERITPAPIEIAPIAALEAITVEDITLAPIIVAPVDEQEKP